MKIAYILQQFPWASETFALSDITALRAAGHTVTVYTFRWKAPDADALSATMGVPLDLQVDRPGPGSVLRAPLTLLIHPIVGLMLAWRMLRGPGNLPARLKAILTIPRAIEIARRIRAAGNDVAHAFWGRHAGLVLFSLARWNAPQLRSGFIGAYDLVLDDVLTRLTLAHTTTLFTHAEANRTFFAGHGRSDVNVVHRGIPLDLGTPPAPQRIPTSIITASALDPRKNISGIIAAVARARAAHPDLTLSIMGDGEDAPALRQRASDLNLISAVTFGGYIGRAALFRHMQQSAIFLFLSRKPSERLPNVVKEAMYAGCYVIAARSEGIEELIPSPDYGAIVDPNDTAAIDAAIERALAETPEQAEDRRARGRSLIETTLSADASMARYVEIWTGALARQ